MRDDLVNVLLEVGHEVVGFGPPPSRVELRVRETRRAWSIHLKCAQEGDVPAVAAWAQALGSRRIEVVSRRGVIADFASPFPAWASLAKAVDVKCITLSPDGPSRLLIEAERSNVQEIVSRIRESGGDVAVRHVTTPATAAALLTPRQHEVLAAAARAGYYDIPRPVNLHGLAKQLGASAASVSERLRRAEARVIENYLENEPGPVIATPVHVAGPVSLAPAETLVRTV